ncbi:MAG TPA: Gfo/Idh/MocA family oxidoreductase [Anaerolineae bacterium]
MSERKIRVGIVGAGANTRSRHIPGLRAIPGVDIVGICNRSIESSKLASQKLSIPVVFDDWRQLVESPDIDAVVIGTWPYMHARVTQAALNSGKHVLCEARMAMNAAEAHAMLDTSQARPAQVAQVVPSPYTLRVDRMIQRLLADGYIGELLAVEVRVGGAFLDAASPLHWRQDFDLSGYNVLGMGIWYEAVMRWIGSAIRVTAMGKIFVRNRRDAGGTLHAVRVPEHVDVIADMACGAQAHFQISSVTGHIGAPEAFLFGTDGTLRFCQDKLYGARRTERQLAELDVPVEMQGHWRVEEEFIAAIRGQGVITHTRFDDGVRYMEFTEAVARSMETGSSITLPL